VRNQRVATFTMSHCAPTCEQAYAEAANAMVWYPKRGSYQTAAAAEYARRFSADGKLGTYFYLDRVERIAQQGGIEAISFDFIRDTRAAMVGDPERCIEIARAYEAAGCDLLLCLANPYDIPHAQVMRSLELLGKHVIPALDRG
jgi:alkanesulfonate monooxygenase SsuD/methylene tetrahydromethanopterin reductase-like flavin-dependent oxidoreductase (luciferase family)